MTFKSPCSLTFTQSKGPELFLMQYTDSLIPQPHADGAVVEEVEAAIERTEKIEETKEKNREMDTAQQLGRKPI